MLHLHDYDTYSLNEKMGALSGLIVYHGTREDFDTFDTSKTIDGGIHFGTREQALMRNSSNIIEAEISIGRPIRLKDEGGGWRSKIAAARRRGFDGIVYLNRYEGIPYERLESLKERGYDGSYLDGVADSRFAKLVPEAQDSYIIFEPRYIRILAKLGK